MTLHIHVFGASGSGTTTLGRKLAQRIQGRQLDADSYYWLETNPPFTRKRDPEDRVRLIQKDAGGTENWVLSGSVCSWGDSLLDSFTLAVFLYLDPTVRMNRILRREAERYGERIHPDGDMYQQHVEFVDWARSYDYAEAPTRSLDLHRRWMQQLKCPVIKLNSDRSVDELCDETLDNTVA